MPNKDHPPTYRTPKKTNTFSKWLVIILLTLIIFGILLTVLLKNNKSDSDPMDDGLTSNNKAESSITAGDFQKDSQPLATISESELADDKEGLENNETETTKKSSEPDPEDGANTENNDNQQLKADSQQQSVNQNRSTNDKLNAAETLGNGVTQQQQNNYPAFDNSVYIAQPQINPNDQVLLPRDLPQAEQNVRIQDENYANAAEQSEDLSDQLSTIVNEVKEQKLQQIEAQQKASREAYLANRGISPESSSTSDSLKTGATESNAETEESVTNQPKIADAP